MKILIVGCYNLSDGYLALSKNFIPDFEIAFFPLYENIYDDNHTQEDILSAITGQPLPSHYIRYMNDSSQQCDMIIWWHNFDIINQNINIISKVKKTFPQIKNIILNWDPQLNFTKFNYNNIFKSFDNILTCNPRLSIYRPKCTFFYPGYDPDVCFYEYDQQYSCDVSFVGTNLYTQYSARCNRKNILDKIYAQAGVTLHIYGPDFLKELYPNAYKGFVPYDECRKVFSNSLINLNISPCDDETINYGDNHYFSERLPQIMACKGLVLSNNSFGDFIRNGEHYIKIDNCNDILDIISKVKNDKIKYDKIRGNALILSHQKLSWKYIYETTIKDILLG